MNKKRLLQKMLNEKNGILLTSDVLKAGISKTYFMEYVKEMQLERIAMGVYISPDAWADYFYLLQARYPQAIFSHETALYLLGLGEREPLQFTITVKYGYHAKSMLEQNIKVYRIKKELYELGIITVDSPAGQKLKIYNAERSICDLLRCRNHVEIQDLQGALKQYIKSKERDIPLLMDYAKYFKVEKILRQYLEVLL